MHWLGPFIVTKIRDSGEVWLAQLDGVLLHGWVNGAGIKKKMQRISIRLRQSICIMQPICGQGEVVLMDTQVFPIIRVSGGIASVDTHVIPVSRVRGHTRNPNQQNTHRYALFPTFMTT